MFTWMRAPAVFKSLSRDSSPKRLSEGIGCREALPQQISATRQQEKRRGRIREAEDNVDGSEIAHVAAGGISPFNGGSECVCSAWVLDPRESESNLPGNQQLRIYECQAAEWKSVFGGWAI